ncbi:uncharacterized protein LOC124891053 [Capsicum annuum]|uniref:uncharacterized protein LOC124891053 n=1 Tax=Capsicum annuum TaxID=4072 RepID=UPI001FB188AC|nr:uncharacterized protein LOC124891053 [Capsicum annuum]
MDLHLMETLYRAFNFVTNPIVDNDITTRNGKLLLGLSVDKSIEDEVRDDEPKESNPVESEKLDSSADDLEKEEEVLLKTIPWPPPPFPQRLKKKVEDAKFRKFMVMHKQLTINMPLIKALEQMSGYARFMKDLITKKRKVKSELVDNLHHCSVVSTWFLVQKKAYPGAFTIPYKIGSLNFAKALYY